MNCENLLTVGKLMGKSLVSCFLTHSVVSLQPINAKYSHDSDARDQ